MRIKDQTIFITGGSDGIGLALAIELAGLGNRVIVCGRREEALRAAKERCANIESICCDISDPADCGDAVRTFPVTSETSREEAVPSTP